MVNLFKRLSDNVVVGVVATTNEYAYIVSPTATDVSSAFYDDMPEHIVDEVYENNFGAFRINLKKLNTEYQNLNKQDDMSSLSLSSKNNNMSTLNTLRTKRHFDNAENLNKLLTLDDTLTAVAGTYERALELISQRLAKVTALKQDINYSVDRQDVAETVKLTARVEKVVAFLANSEVDNAIEGLAGDVAEDDFTAEKFFN